MVFENLSIFGIFHEGLVTIEYSLSIHDQNTVWVQLKRSNISLFLLFVIGIRLAENQWRLKDYWIHRRLRRFILSPPSIMEKIVFVQHWTLEMYHCSIHNICFIFDLIYTNILLITHLFLFYLDSTIDKKHDLIM